jgi:FkbM family methyltransferase
MTVVESRLISRLRATPAVSGPALKMLRFLHLHEPALRKIHHAEIEQRRAFYSDAVNVTRIDEICRSLHDKESVETFRRAIRFQQTYSTSDAPEHTGGQYFVDGIVSLSDKEVLLDCGAFSGDTVRAFVEACNGHYSRIVCFEPDSENFRQLSRRTRKLDRVALVRAGAWKENGTLRFVGGMKLTSKIAGADSDGSCTLVDVLAIDESEVCQGVTYLKMDIEGAEMNALRGAEKTIGASLPRLAISIYHSPEDMLDIPEYLHSKFPDYRLYVRHHSREAVDTVLYAISDRDFVGGGLARGMRARKSGASDTQ